MAYLVLVRHGRSLWGELGLWTGLTDIALSKEGKKEVVFLIILDICVMYKELGQVELAKEILEGYVTNYGSVMDISVKTEIERKVLDPDTRQMREPKANEMNQKFAQELVKNKEYTIGVCPEAAKQTTAASMDESGFGVLLKDKKLYVTTGCFGPEKADQERKYEKGILEPLNYVISDTANDIENKKIPSACKIVNAKAGEIAKYILDETFKGPDVKDCKLSNDEDNALHYVCKRITASPTRPPGAVIEG